MSKSQCNISDADVQRMADMFKALSNPHRLRIYVELASYCRDTVLSSPEEKLLNCQREFAESLGLAPSTVSHHFKELRQAGLIHMEREGKDIRFWVDQHAAKLMKDFVA